MGFSLLDFSLNRLFLASLREGGQSEKSACTRGGARVGEREGERQRLATYLDSDSATFSITEGTPVFTPTVGSLTCSVLFVRPSSFILPPGCCWPLGLSHNLHRAGKVTHPRSACRAGVIRVIDSHLFRSCIGCFALLVRLQHNNSRRQLGP